MDSERTLFTDCALVMNDECNLKLKNSAAFKTNGNFNW